MLEGGSELDSRRKKDLESTLDTMYWANAGTHSHLPSPLFFLTPLLQPWLDNKHTVFGRVTRGMEVAQKISEVKVHPKTDKPYEDIKIMNVTLK